MSRFKGDAAYMGVRENDGIGKEKLLAGQFIEITGQVSLRKYTHFIRRVSYEMKRINENLLTNHLDFDDYFRHL